MKDKDLRKLSRGDLVEILLLLQEENEQLRGELELAKLELENRQIKINNAGSIAEASLQLNGVFVAAEDACRQYTDNIQTLSQRQEEICRRMEQETQARCRQMINDAKVQAQAYWDEYNARFHQFAQQYEALRQILESGGTQGRR